MRILLILCGALVLAGQEGDEHAAIRAALARLNEARTKGDPALLARLFTADADYRDGSGRLVRGSQAVARLLAGHGPWSEVTAPLLLAKNIRLLQPGAALVDATAVQYGSLIVKRCVPVAIALRESGGEWRIAAYRVLGARGVHFLPVHPQLCEATQGVVRCQLLLARQAR